MTVSYRHKQLGVWRETTLDQLREQAGAVREALVALGLRSGGRIVVLSGNRPEWFVVDLAAGDIGAEVVGLPPFGPLEVPEAALFVVEDEEQLDRLGPRPVPIVVIEPPPSLPEGVVTFGELAARPGATTDLDAPGEGPGAGDELLAHVPLTDPGERALLSAAVRRGATVNFGDGAAPLVSDLREVQPTVFRAPPATWRAFRDDVEHRAADATRLKRAAYRRRLLVRRPVRRALGLGRLRVAESTGPIDEDVAAWFAGFGIEVVARG